MVAAGDEEWSEATVDEVGQVEPAEIGLVAIGHPFDSVVIRDLAYLCRLCIVLVP